MDVYYNGNGYTWGAGPRSQKLTEIPIGKTFFWGDQEIFLPALYVGQDGVVLDVCTKIPLEKMLLFLRKWNKERRLSLRTPEEFEEMDADNPSSREFLADLCLDGEPLTCCTGSSLRWYPTAVFAASDPDEAAAMDISGTDTAFAGTIADTTAGPASDTFGTDAAQNTTISGMEKTQEREDWSNDPKAELLMAAYGCDRECCWHLGRMVYAWNDAPILSPRNISLRFKAHPFSVTAGHFTTDASCQGRQIQTVHPLTGQEYTLTLHNCESTRHDFTEISTEGLRYPEYNQILTYSVSPEIERSLLDIRDCTEGDQPKVTDASCEFVESLSTADCASASSMGDSPAAEDGSYVTTSFTTMIDSYPTAVFMTWKDPAPDRRMAASSMRFAPASETHWRIVFQVNDKEDLELQFDL